uniref:Candidate secreted effector n=1 Tax=Meloidogyne incognita TaxID=6306 RepID=A0A914MFW9_MELIC
MPRTIEHKIKLIGSTTPSSIISEYGTVERKKSPSNFDNEILHSRGNENNNRSHSANRKANEITYGKESFERNLHYSPNEIEREQFSCRTFGERCSLGVDDSNRKDKFQNKNALEPIHPINHSYDNSDPFSHPMHNDNEWNVFDSDDDISRDGKNEREGLPRLSPSKQINSSNERRISPKIIVPAEQNKQFYQNNYLPNNIQSPPQMKRIIKKSRLVSIHDGRPLSDFVETVHYEPINYCYF